MNQNKNVAVEFVQLTVESYNALLLENRRLRDAVVLREEPWQKSVVIELNLQAEVVQDILKDKFAKSTFSDDYTLTNKNDMYSPNTSIARKKPEEDAVNA